MRSFPPEAGRVAVSAALSKLARVTLGRLVVLRVGREGTVMEAAGIEAAGRVDVSVLGSAAKDAFCRLSVQSKVHTIHFLTFFIKTP